MGTNESPTDHTQPDLGLERTRMALMRTDYTLMRTGFTIASFGVGVTHLIGRQIWPDIAVDLLTVLFLVTGMILVQCGITGSRKSYKELNFEGDVDGLTRFMINISPWMLQGGLLALLVLTLAYEY